MTYIHTNLKLPAVICVLLWSSSVVSDASDGVVAGGTAPPPVVSESVAGGITVDIRSAQNGVSHNTYTHFNVPEAGVTLNNDPARASFTAADLIINEVTSGNRSTLEGALTISGNKAHVVVANPNGITVDGGSFVNSAGVMLTTGDIHRFTSVVGDTLTTIDSAAGPYYVAYVNDGAIRVTDRGVGGSFPRLDLMAKTITVEGGLDIDNVTTLYGGDSTIVFEYDTSTIDPASYESADIFQSIYPGSCDGSSIVSDSADWDCSKMTTGTAASGTDYVIDVTGSSAAIESGTINITVNDTGAGFRFAGESLVSEASDLSISSAGGIEVVASNGGTMTSVSDLSLRATDSDITLTGSASSQAAITAGQDLSIVIDGDTDTNNAIVNTGYALQSILPSESAALLNGSVAIQATTFVNRSLSESGLGIVFSASNKVGSGGYSWGGSDSRSGGVQITTTGDLYNESARIISNNGVSFSVGGDIYNRVIRASGSNDGIVTSTSTTSGWFLFKKTSTTQHYDYGELAVDGLSSYITASSGDIQMDFTVNGRLYNVGGEISANGSQNYVPVQVTFADAGLDNNASALASNELTLASGDSSLTYTFTGGATEAGVDDGLEMLLGFVEYVDDQRSSDPTLFSDLTSLEVVRTSSGADENGAYGLLIGSESASAYGLSGVDGATPKTFRLANASGTVSDGSVFLGGLNTDAATDNAVSAVVNQVVVSGQASRESSCRWFCDQSGGSSVVITGGLISAQNQLDARIQAMSVADSQFADAVDYSQLSNLSGIYQSATTAANQGYFTNVGGRVTALNNVENDNGNAINIYAANDTGVIRVLAEALPTYNVTKRNQGYLSRDFVKILRQDQGGSFLASLGQINLSNLVGTGLDGQGVHIRGGSLVGATGITLDDEDDTDSGTVRDQNDIDPNLTEPVSDSPASNDNIGATGKLLEHLF